MDPKGNPQGAVPPYEPNPAYNQQAPMQHNDSYNNNNQIHQYPQQQQQQQQYTPMSSPPIHDQPKQEYYAGQENNPAPIHPQQTMPIQHQAQVAQAYQTATPIANLGEGAAPVDCSQIHIHILPGEMSEEDQDYS
ncbi:MAG: hypothetical protein Q9226_006724 [Calogaya cf. arnoldii]